MRECHRAEQREVESFQAALDDYDDVDWVVVSRRWRPQSVLDILPVFCPAVLASAVDGLRHQPVSFARFDVLLDRVDCIHDNHRWEQRRFQ